MTATDNKALEHRNKLLEFDRTRLETSERNHLIFNRKIILTFFKNINNIAIDVSKKNICIYNTVLSVPL